MPVFYGRLQHPDDEEQLQATVVVGERTLRLQTGQTLLGEWKLGQVLVDERPDRSVTFTADGESLYLYLDEHERFVDVMAPYQPSRGARRRAEAHPAFREEDTGPSLGDEVKREVGREVGSLAEEARGLRDMVKPGPVLWVGLALLFALIVFAPGIATALALGAGMLALIAGGAGYAESSVAARIPDPLTPARLLVIGGALVALGVVIAIIR